MGSVVSSVGNAFGSVVNGLTGGISNTNHYNTGAPDITRQDFGNAIANSQGQFNDNYGQQQGLAQALQEQMAGRGPNPAMDQYHAAVQQNVAQQNAAMASQRGMNPALAARLSSEQGANMNQQAAQQSAIMRAQQSLGAQGQLAGLYNQMGNQAAGMYGTQQNAQAQQNNALTQGQLGAAQINAGVAAGNAERQYETNTGLLQGVGAAIGMGGKAHGGFIEGLAKVQGDSLKNDVVPTMLSPGEIVIPRTAATSADKAKAFIDHLMAQEENGYGKVLQARRKVRG